VPPGRKTSVIQQSVTVNHEPGKLTVSGRMVTVDTGAGVRRLVGHGGARHHGHTTPAEPLLRDGIGTIGLRPVPSRFPMAPLWTRAVRRLLPDIPALLPGAGRLDLKPPFVAGETSTAYDRTRLAFKLADQPRSPDI